eukprot:TRINITY_DN2716_c0_g1_i1.p1 TRINITY_DN2716_c0_g1~~TRINITY_DN2716_c0_g1_i1.p1  ORF type:complete len:248 (-),score=37.32 TRINITY_DN2716_c0_g1_i1:246-989(-)
MKTFISLRIFIVCSQLKCSENVIASAITFFKRFLLYRSLLSYEFESILVLSVLLATKVEEERIGINAIIKEFGFQKIQSETAFHDFKIRTLALEYDFLNILKYHLTIHHPYQPEHGFSIELAKHSSLDHASIIEIRKAASLLITKSIILSDLMFMYKPNEIALAALSFATTKLGYQEQFNTFIHTVLFQEPPELIERITSTLTQLTDIFEECDRRLEDNYQITQHFIGILTPHKQKFGQVMSIRNQQ